MKMPSFTISTKKNLRDISKFLLQDYVEQQEECLIKVKTLHSIMSTRIPIHIATIECGNLVPLENGKNFSDQLID